MGIKITGLDDIQKKFSDSRGLISEIIDDKGGIDFECPSCGKTIQVPTTGTTCSCGQKINFQFKE